MNRLLKNIGLALLFLVAVLVLVNIFVLMPLMRLEPDRTTYVPAGEVTEAVRSDTDIVAVDTLAVIKKNGLGEGPVYIDPEDENLRNPFFWPEEKRQRKKAEEPAVQKPQLTMVIIGENHKQALLDDAFVREGDMYHGYLVKRIEEHQVVLSDELGELRIFLAADPEKDDQLEPPPGLIEK